MSKMLTFDRLVERGDHKPHVHLFNTVGTRSVSVADLRYDKPTTVERTVSEFVLTVHLSPCVLEVDVAGRKRPRYAYKPGMLDLTPAHSNYSSQRFDGGRALAISIPKPVVSELLTEVAQEEVKEFSAVHARPQTSPLVAASATALADELKGGSGLGPLYADTLVQASVVELFRMSKLQPHLAISRDNKLCAATLRLIDDYIDAHADQALELSELASLAAMASSTFSRAFRRTTSLSPYQYVLRRRLTKAQEMIAGSTAPLAQVAFDCGFSSQAHMTSLFKAKLGVTPGEVRSQLFA